MTLPARLNLVDITIKQIQKSGVNATWQDPDFREPANTANFADSIVIQGQPNLGSRSFEQLLRSITGSEERTRGHIVFKKETLDSAGITLQVGDKITDVGGFSVDLTIREVRPESPLDGSFLLLYAVFENNPETVVSN